MQQIVQAFALQIVEVLRRFETELLHPGVVISANVGQFCEVLAAIGEHDFSPN